MLDEFEGIVDLTPFWVKNLEKISDFTVDATFVLAFLVDRHQTWYVHSPKHRAWIEFSIWLRLGVILG